jgi:hypothetical protein
MTNATVNPTTAKTPDTNKDAVAQMTQAAQACCQGANDAFKAYAEANQKLFGSFTKAWSTPFFNTGWTAGWNPQTWEKSDNQACTMNPFDSMVKMMNGVVDAHARFATECNALTIDAIRTNVRTLERMGTMMNDMAATQASRVTGTPAAKNTKPFADTAREIFDEASTFMAKTSERMMKMNTEHVQSVAKVMDEVVVRPLAAAGAAATKGCCNA